MRRWFVVNAHTGQEQRAEFNLHRQGYCVWLPSFRKLRKHARKTVSVDAAVFPGYLFVEFDPDADRWYPIMNTFGVRRLLSNERGPVAVPQRFLDNLRGHLALDGEAPDALPELAAGAELEVVSGPFAGSFATFLGLAAQERVRVLLNVLGAGVRTTLPAAGVRIVA